MGRGSARPHPPRPRPARWRRVNADPPRPARHDDANPGVERTRPGARQGRGARRRRRRLPHEAVRACGTALPNGRRTAARGGPAADAGGAIELGPIRLDPARRTATVAGNPVDLTPREYELLKTLLANQGRLVTKQRLLRAVWGTAYAGEEHYLHVYVSRLRRKLEAADPAALRAA